MITIAISWIITFYTLFSLGDILIHVYNKICRDKEIYNILDTFILGICFVSILLPLTSFWLPSNEYILLTYIVISVIYWIINRERLVNYFHKLKDFYNSMSLIQLFFILIPILSVLVYMYIFDHFYDAEYYHYQNIKWNEKFAIVPGLGNLEDRFAFNSNYLLLSAIFTFRFLFGEGEAVYILQSLLYICILTWITVSFIKSNHNILYPVLLALSFIIIFRYGFMFGSSSTDIIPILCSFYYLAKTILEPEWLKKQPLLACLLPITLITFKLSAIFFSLISLFVIVYLIKQKKHRNLIAIITLCFLVIALWCIRNVIVSGYLVYPVYYVDLFSLDWKMPKGTAILQQMHIYHWAKIMFLYEVARAFDVLKGQINDMESIGCIFNVVLAIIVIVSPCIIIYNFLKKRVSKEHFYLYLLIIFCIVLSIISAPDFRFVYGYILGIVFLLAFIYKRKKDQSNRISKVSICLSVVVIIGFGFVATKKFIEGGERIGSKFDSLIDFIALYHHRSPKNINSFEEYKMGNHIIYINKEYQDNRTFDLLPATDPHGIPSEPFTGLRIQAIETIELRGSDLQDGFRTKREYIDTINNNIEKYKTEYLEYKGLKKYTGLKN